MIEVKIDVSNSIPLIILKGRLDSYGASLFDKHISSLEVNARDIIIDASEVDYISSSGIRSLVSAQKILIAKGGGLILHNISPFLEQKLTISGLLGGMCIVNTLDEAKEKINDRRQFEKKITRHNIRERDYTVQQISDKVSQLDLWGSFENISGEILAADGLQGVTIEELGLAFGIGGLGMNRAQAAESLGQFVSTGKMAGVIPADGYCITDFMIPGNPAESIVYLAAGIGIMGMPAFLIEGKYGNAVTISDLTEDIYKIIKERRRDTPPIIAMAIIAKAPEVVCSLFKEKNDIASSTYQTEKCLDTQGIFVAGVCVDAESAKASKDKRINGFLKQMLNYPSCEGGFFHGHGIKLNGRWRYDKKIALEDALLQMTNIERLQGVAHIEPGTMVKDPKVWIYVPATVCSGAEKMMKVSMDDGSALPDEWEVIVKRLYSDAYRVKLTPFHGGCRSKAFSVTSYGRDGCRMLPTVLKIGSIELTKREEVAFRKYVEQYILNNSTAIKGTTFYGDWAGLRYNLLGINGPDSRLSCLTDCYKRYPVYELIPIFNSIFTYILKPWYGQPQWEILYPFAEHNPLVMLPTILADAERVLGISPEKKTLHCPEMGIDLPNPYYFLKYEYKTRKRYSRLWYKGITHGDLNMQNILLDERENIYVIDFSETRIRNIVSDFARLEPIFKIEMTRLDGLDDMKLLLEFESGLARASFIDEMPPFIYKGSDEMVEKAYKLILLLRSYADKATIFERDIIPYLMAVLEWTYPIVSYRDVSLLRKRFSAYSAGIIVKKLGSSWNPGWWNY